MRNIHPCALRLLTLTGLCLFEKDRIFEEDNDSQDSDSDSDTSITSDDGGPSVNEACSLRAADSFPEHLGRR